VGAAGVEEPLGLIVRVALWVTFSYVAEITTVEVVVTCAALTVNVALVWPEGTTTLNGTVASTELLVARFTTAFPLGAAERSVTVPVEEAGPTTVVGFKVTEETALETTRNRGVLTVVPAREAEMFTGVVWVTGAVFAVNVALVWPAGTVTLAGTVTSEVFALESVTRAPPSGAGPFNVTLPVAGVPPGTLPLNSIWPSSGNSVMSALTVAEFQVAEIRTFVAAVTELLLIENEALVWPAGTVTLVGMVMGTVPEAPLENAFESVTSAPPDGAAPLNVTVPVDEAPPTSDTGSIFTALTVTGPPGVISNNAPWFGLPLRLAKTFRLNCEVTGEVLIVKLALVAPAGTVTLW
jgi:hypothetical protein